MAINPFPSSPAPTWGAVCRLFLYLHKCHTHTGRTGCEHTISLAPCPAPLPACTTAPSCLCGTVAIMVGDTAPGGHVGSSSFSQEVLAFGVPVQWLCGGGSPEIPPPLLPHQVSIGPTHHRSVRRTPEPGGAGVWTVRAATVRLRLICEMGVSGHLTARAGAPRSFW